MQARAHALLKAKDAAITSAREGLEQEYAQQLQTQETAAAEARAQAEQASHRGHLSCEDRREIPFAALLPMLASLLLPFCHLSMRLLPCLPSSVQPDYWCTAEAMQTSQNWPRNQCRPSSPLQPTHHTIVTSKPGLGRR